MLELTKEQSTALEKAALNQMCAQIPEESRIAPLFEQIARIAVLATITTIKEYERMKSLH